MRFRTTVTLPTGIVTSTPPRRISVALVSTMGRTPAVGAQIDDSGPSPTTVYSSQRTEAAIDEAVAEQLYDYDALVQTNLNV